MNRNFFWNKNVDGKGDTTTIPTVAWDMISRPKYEGGLGKC